MGDGLCLDASVLVKVYLPEDNSEEADRLLDDALARGTDIVAPSFLLAEVLSVVRRQVYRGILATERADAILERLFVLPIRESDGREVYERAWRLAQELAMPVIYDAVYLAVAELAGATFWTADRVLFEKAGHKQYVRLLGESRPS